MPVASGWQGQIVATQIVATPAGFAKSSWPVYDVSPYMEGRNKNTKVVVVGGANLDIHGISLAPFSLRDSNPGRIARASGGVGRNIAENCAKLGLSTSLVTAFGEDREGDFLLADCAAKGIDTEWSLRAPGRTAIYLCALDPDGSLVAAVADMDIMAALSPDLLETRRPLFDSADYLVADANLPADSIRWLAEHYGRKARSTSRKSKPLLYFDTVSAAKAPRASGLSGEFDCMKPNRIEAAILAGREGSATGLATPEMLCAAMAGRECLPAELFISLGEEGLYYYVDETENGRVSLPPPGLRPSPVNRSGAGDAACAALVWATSIGCTPREKAKYGLAAALLAAASPEPVAVGISESMLEAQMRLMFPEE